MKLCFRPLHLIVKKSIWVKCLVNNLNWKSHSSIWKISSMLFHLRTWLSLLSVFCIFRQKWNRDRNSQAHIVYVWSKARFTPNNFILRKYLEDWFSFCYYGDDLSMVGSSLNLKISFQECPTTGSIDTTWFTNFV